MRATVGRMVHYVSYGTPGGEYGSVCRSATVTEVGAWVDTDVTYDQGDSTVRTVTQRWDPDTCALEVHNPTGLFFNTCPYDAGTEVGEAVQGVTARTYRGGTWHWPERYDDPPPAGAAVAHTGGDREGP